MVTINAKGQLCPKPLIMTKKALMELEQNETLEILIDNEISMKNVSRFLIDNGYKPIIDRKGIVYHIIVSKTGEILESVEINEYCQIKKTQISNHIIAFQRNWLGDGDQDLGKILIKAFVNTIPETSTLPKALIFLNSGIFLVLNDSYVIDSLRKLEGDGVSILVCGTCLDYYGKKEEIAVGKISNMYEILEILSTANNIIYP